MNYTSDQNKVIRLFEESSNTPLSYNEIVMASSATRNDKAKIKAAISQLIELGVLAKSKKKFSLTQPKLVVQPSPTLKSPQLVEGTFDATSLARNYSFAFVRTPSGDFYVSSEDTLNAYHNDKVLVEPFYKQGKPDFCRVRQITERANARMAGDIKQSGAMTIFVCSSPKIHNWFRVEKSEENLEGKKVILEVTNWGNPKASKGPIGKVVEILGDSGDPATELLAVIRQYQLPLEFPEDVLAALDEIPEEISPEDVSQRTDLRKLFTFTVDPASAKDYDDAISLEQTGSGWKLYVHIADVAHYLKVDGAIFQEACKRGNSFYFPKKVIPMLPERLSNGVCSLRPEEDKLCMTVITEFDQKANILKQNLVESIIRSNYRLSYEQVDELYEGSQTELDPKLIQALEEARKLSSLLTGKRMQAGYIFFDLPEIEYHYDEEGFLHEFSLAEETESHKMIENFMLIANEYTAKQLSQKAPASVYRIHDDPDWEKLTRLFDTLSAYGIPVVVKENPNKTVQGVLYSLPSKDHHRVFDRVILRSMKKAKYSIDHIRHFGLAMEDYTHFTSPIRRLCDLLVHHLCKTYLLKSSNVKFSKEQLKHYSEQASEQEILANEAEREIERIYKLAYMKNKQGEHYTGIVVATNSSSLIVRFNEIPVTGVIKNSQFISSGFVYLDREMRFVNKRTGYYYQLLDLVKVQVAEVSDDVYLEFSNDDENHIHQSPGRDGKASVKRESRPNQRKGANPRKRVDYKGGSGKLASQKNRKGKK